MNCGGGFRDRRRLLEKSGLSAVGLDQMEMHARGQREDEAGEAAAGSEVDSMRRLPRHIWNELECILDMARPKTCHVVAAHELDRRIPAGQQTREGDQAVAYGGI